MTFEPEHTKPRFDPTFESVSMAERGSCLAGMVARLPHGDDLLNLTGKIGGDEAGGCLATLLSRARVNAPEGLEDVLAAATAAVLAGMETLKLFSVQVPPVRDPKCYFMAVDCETAMELPMGERGLTLASMAPEFPGNRALRTHLPLPSSRDIRRPSSWRDARVAAEALGVVAHELDRNVIHQACVVAQARGWVVPWEMAADHRDPFSPLFTRAAGRYPGGQVSWIVGSATHIAQLLGTPEGQVAVAEEGAKTSGVRLAGRLEGLSTGLPIDLYFDPLYPEVRPALVGFYPGGSTLNAGMILAPRVLLGFGVEDQVGQLLYTDLSLPAPVGERYGLLSMP